MGLTILSPGYQLLFDGLPLSLLENRLKSLQIENTIEGDIDQITLSFDDRPIALGQHIPIPPIGTTVLAWLGSGPLLISMGTFYVDSWAISMPPAELALTAKSINFKGTFFDQQTKTWEKMSLQMLVESLAAKHALLPFVSEEYAEVQIQELQDVESDANFLSRLAKKYNAFFKVAQEKLLFLQYNTFQTMSGQILGSVPLLPVETMNWHVSYKETQEFGQVTTKWYDQQLATYQSCVYPPVATSKKIYQLRKTFGSESEAYYAAKSKYESLERDKEYIQIECNGNASLTAGGQIALTGFRGEVDGIWVVTRVTHTLNAQGFRSQVHAYRFSLEDQL